MAEAMVRDGGAETAAGHVVIDAARRLDKALARLESALAESGARGAGAIPDAPDTEALARRRDSLAIDLNAARARERALMEAAAEASAALGRAAAEVRAALGDTFGEEEAA